MTLRNSQEISSFRGIVENTRGDIWVQDERGRRFDLKREMDLYRVIGIMLENPGNALELYTSDYDAQLRLEGFFIRQMMGIAV